MNVLAFFTMQFAAYLLLNFMSSFLYFLVTSPYYNVPSDRVGRIVGDLGFYGSLAVVSFDFFLGAIMDIIGRKIPIIIGLVVSSIMIIVMPFGNVVYPSLLLWRYDSLFDKFVRTIWALGLAPALNSPLLVDYIAKDSLGLANAYVRKTLITFQ